MNLKLENTEIESQSHKMWAEGTSDKEPSKTEVREHMVSNGWCVKNIEIWFDSMQGFWRWNCDLINKI